MSSFPHHPLLDEDEEKDVAVALSLLREKILWRKKMSHSTVFYPVSEYRMERSFECIQFLEEILATVQGKDHS